MLTKRTNILLEEQTFNYLAALAEKKGASVGKLIRYAINDVYLIEENKARQQKQATVKKIIKQQENIKTAKKIDYRKLVEHGRRL